MQSSSDGDVVLAKLDDGEDLVPSVERLAADHGVENGMVLWGIGMLREAEVGYFNGREYERTEFVKPRELLALHGSIAARADPRLHLHVALAGPDKSVVGGHLFRATVAVLNEVCLWRLRNTRLDRVLSPSSGLRELAVAREPPL